MVVAVSMTLPSASVFGAEYSQELQDAYNWAYSKGVTTMSPIDNANMYGAITRAEMAKMLSVYSTEVLKATPDTSAACTFSDIDSVKGDLHDYIIESCQLGIMGQGITAFRPYDTISRAEFGTALSRVLWGSTYEGGTPYYAKHLDALKTNAIMNQIANAESTKEIRGYVMLMLMRSETNAVDCDDPVVALACLDEEAEAYKECPAACREDASDNTNEDGEVVKSGSLAVSSSAADDRKVVVASDGFAVSDLDTLTFKTSEAVTLQKVVLEKYGYSTASDLISNVWLEDEDGKEVSNKAKPNTKWLVNLTIKKDYKTIDGTFNATIVVETNSGAKVGGTLGFKVTDVNSTAKDVDLGDYKAYTYDVVAYDGTEAKVTAKGWSKDYNYEGKAVEISKFKIKAPDDSAIKVAGFTLTNSGSLDIYDNIDAEDVEVSIDGKTVKANISINKSEEMSISLKESLEIAAKAQVEVIVSASFNDDFEDYGNTVMLKIEKPSDLSATDKNNARITVNTASAKWVEYVINGGKVRITTTKLGNVDASINSTDILIASGYITVGEDLEKGKLIVTVTWSGEALEAMKLEIAGDEYDGETKDNGKTWTFDNIEISESGKIRLYVDILDKPEYENATLQFSIEGWDSFKYTNGDKNSKVDVSGSLTISKLNLNPAEGTLVNKLSSSDDVEFNNNELNTEIVFDGTYKADKQDINLNSFTISTTTYTGASKIKFYLYVDDMNSSVADVTITKDALSGADSFNDVLVEAGKEVKVKVEAEIDAKEATAPFKVGKFNVELDGEDENDNVAGHAERKTANIMIVNQGSATVEEGDVAKNVVLRKANSSTIAQFIVKPDAANRVTLEEISFDLAFTPAAGAEDYDGNVDLYVKGSKKTLKNSGNSYEAEFSTDVDSEWVKVTVELDDEFDGEVSLTNLKVNDKEIKNKDFNKKFVEAVVWFTDQKSDDDNTTFKFGIDKKGSDSIENVTLTLKNGNEVVINNGKEIKANSPYDVVNLSGWQQDVVGIKYTVNGGTVEQEATYACFSGDNKVAGVTTGADCVPWTWEWKIDTPAVIGGYIEISNTPYADMFKIGMKDDGAQVRVARLKNS